MKTISISFLAACFAASAASAQSPLNFDQGRLPASALIGDKAIEPKGIETTRPCAIIEFSAGAPAKSKEQTLISETWDTSCIATPPVGCVPQRRRIWKDTRHVTLEIADRDFSMPEKFRACLSGKWLSLDVVKSPFSYAKPELKEDGDNAHFTLKRK